MDSFCWGKQCCGNCSQLPGSCAHDTMLPLSKHFQASWWLQDFDFSNSDSNCSFIQFLSRVCVVGILHECKSQRYHSRLWTKGWWWNSFSSNRLKVYQNSYCAPAACSSTVALSGRGYSSSGFQDSLWTCSTLFLTSQLPTPPDDCTPPGFHSCLGMWVRAASAARFPSSQRIFHNTFCSLFYPATTLWKGFFRTSRKTL